MLLTVTTTHRPATDLGYLLHKHPDRVQSFEQSFGTAWVYYPEATEERCTAALLLDIDPVSLARGRGRTRSDFSLGQYVNDRSYAASSLLAVALGDVFGTARSGRCRSRQELADTAIGLEITVPVAPCRGGPEVAERVFGPLGWQVEATPIGLDPAFPGWGDSRYVRLELRGELRLAEALNHLHVLLPALDESKHYWQGTDEVDKLLRSGGEWLARHPERELITRRYLQHRPLTHDALTRLAELDEVPASVQDGEVEQPDAVESPRTSLNLQRHDAVLQVITEVGATSVIDLGCGSGQFLQRLVATGGIERIVGVDASVRSLRQAARRLHLDQLGERAADRIDLFQGALTYRDPRFAGFDVAVLMEVVEHVDPPRLVAVESVVFGAAAPGVVVVTTPNREYNALYPDLVGMRHPDHRFEWDREEFAAWSDRVGAAYGYRVEQRGVGDTDPERGTPTQMAIFTREGGGND